MPDKNNSVDHPIHTMKPGDVAVISREDLINWRVEASRISRAKDLRFKFIPFLDISINVECHPKHRLGTPIKYPEIHELGVGESYRTTRMLTENYRKVIGRIEKATDKRFLMAGNEYGLTITRLPDLADKKAHTVPKNKYGLGEIRVGSYRKFNQTANQTRVSYSVDQYTKRTNGLFRFKKEWRGGDLYVHRIA